MTNKRKDVTIKISKPLNVKEKEAGVKELPRLIKG